MKTLFITLIFLFGLLACQQKTHIGFAIVHYHTWRNDFSEIHRMKLHPIYDTSDYELIFNDNMKYENFDSIEVFLKWTFPDPDGNPNVSLPGVNRIILINPPDESKTQH